jgi:hypothetical protein
MSLWNRLFGKGAGEHEPLRSSENPEGLPQFPYELVRVTGNEAVQVCKRLRDEGRGVFTPLSWVTSRNWNG